MMPHPSRGTARRCAVVGSGAAALGVLSALLEHPYKTEITVFDIGHNAFQPGPESEGKRLCVADYYDHFYREIRRLHPRKFPPPKTHFAQQIARQSVEKNLSIYKSETFGGLTNYWGATMLPFTDLEFTGWPIGRTQLNHYYSKIANIVGISARSDQLDEYFGESYSTAPPIRPISTLAMLDEMISSSNQPGDYRVVSGFNRCALETRQDHPNSCIYCGECMAGCFRKAIFSSSTIVKKYLRHQRISAYVRGRVLRVDGRRGRVEYISSGSETIEECNGFSHIFLCAGCPATTEIVMRSLSMPDGPIIRDNSVYTFPILYSGHIADVVEKDRYLSLCNIIIGCIPSNASDSFAQVQLYPNFDYLWRYNLSHNAWRLIGPLVRMSRCRLLWARLYLHSDYSQSYACEIRDDSLQLSAINHLDCEDYVAILINSIRNATNSKAFHFQIFPPIRERTNSHYAGTMPFNGELVPVSSVGEIDGSGTYICDSSTFPASPAVSPTFSIMANALRVATEVLNG